MDKVLKYTGKALEEPYVPNPNEKPELNIYLPSAELVEAVNLAIMLKRPLLLTGDPGCGKTRLAEAVAYEFYGPDYKKHFFRWDIKSSSKAKDGLYRMDSMRRLQDAQLKELKNIKEYISFGELAQAIRQSTAEAPAILLIDEVDKAEVDFPNDLLLELDKNEFVIDEYDLDDAERRVSAKHSPIIFITSNNEQELSPAFLRRCLYHFIEFPEQELLEAILTNLFKEQDATFVSNVVTDFRKTRARLLNEVGAEKSISTSELIDWFKVIRHANQLKDGPIQRLEDFEQSFIDQLGEIGSERIPYHQTLVKGWYNYQYLMKPEKKK